jgi:malate dehydrogenase (oxaloacetate-decarboxylating)(NADP+)
MVMSDKNQTSNLIQGVTKQEALDFHSAWQNHRAGKIETKATKPLSEVRTLAIAYSPGVAYPCLEIAKNEELAYEYTSKGNFVAIISNGTAVLGLGNIGSAASKPVMEGKAILLKNFADVDSIDIEISTQDTQEVIKTIANIANTWGGINLEDIKAPECFEIETKLQEMLDIPVFHDDQHGTAVVVLAGLINACEITDRKIEDIKVVINGAGAAAIACAQLLKSYGTKNIILCDSKGVVYNGRTEGMNIYKQQHAYNTNARTLNEALIGADVFIGVSVKDALEPEALKKMNKNPVVFAMANPDPEILPDVAKSIRSDIIIGTGRSDYPNQVNNLLCFPYLFRGALDVRARKITTEMKIAVSKTLAAIAKMPIPQEVKDIYPNREFEFGKDYLIPTPFDPRLLSAIAPEVARVAIEQSIARKAIDINEYRAQLLKKV